MLKIKDDVDLKELEKFGFKYRKGTNVYREVYYFAIYNKKHLFPTEACFVEVDSKQIILGTWLYTEGMEIVYDLIKDDMVEKVVEE